MEDIKASMHFNIDSDLSVILNAVTCIHNYTFAKNLLILYVHEYEKNC